MRSVSSDARAVLSVLRSDIPERKSTAERKLSSSRCQDSRVSGDIPGKNIVQYIKLTISSYLTVATLIKKVREPSFKYRKMRDEEMEIQSAKGTRDYGPQEKIFRDQVCRN